MLSLTSLSSSYPFSLPFPKMKPFPSDDSGHRDTAVARVSAETTSDSWMILLPCTDPVCAPRCRHLIMNVDTL